MFLPLWLHFWWHRFRWLFLGKTNVIFEFNLTVYKGAPHMLVFHAFLWCSWLRLVRLKPILLPHNRLLILLGPIHNYTLDLFDRSLRLWIIRLGYSSFVTSKFLFGFIKLSFELGTMWITKMTCCVPGCLRSIWFLFCTYLNWSQSYDFKSVWQKSVLNFG